MRAYRDMGLSIKLFLSMILIAAVGMIIGIIGISGMDKLSREDRDMYERNTLPMLYIAAMYDTLASQRICANNAVIFLEVDPQFSREELDDISNKEVQFDEALRSYSTVLSNDTEVELYNNIYRLYYNDFKAVKASVRTAVDSGDSIAMAEAILAMDRLGSDISDYFDMAFDLNDNLASEKVQSNETLHQSSVLVLVLVMIAGALFAAGFAVFLGKLISRPLRRIKDITRQVAETGSLSFSKDIENAIRDDARYKDETGQVARAFAAMMDALTEKTAILETVASGDLTPDVPLASPQDTIGNAIVHMLDSLNEMFTEINSISVQVATSSGNVSTGAQILAQGASEQASTIGEISASISEIVSQSDVSAQTSDKATVTGDKIRVIAIEGSGKMQNMMNAVQDIHDASRSIEKVIKTIDDIAFQTNILALNAAVEAARAGQHGKGFAVVAEEVRNLAAKSAEAAKETSDLIKANITKTELGLSISTDTSGSFQQIVEGIQNTGALLQMMAEQTATMRTATMQVRSAIDQVAQVVHQNSATSEQSAAASQEMTGQADMLQSMVSRFKLRSETGLLLGNTKRLK